MGGGERGRSAAAACRTHRKIKGASPFIDQVKIGLHLQLSLRSCLFVCIDKPCDLADRTLCLLSIQRRGGGRGGCKEEEEEQRSAAKSTSSSPKYRQTFLLPLQPGVKEALRSTSNLANWTIGGKLSPDPPQTKVTNQMEANSSILTVSERALPVLQGPTLSNDFYSSFAFPRSPPRRYERAPDVLGCLR